MPLLHISLRSGKSASYHQALFDGLYQAMHETFNVPEDDQFMTITEHEASTFRYSPSYLGVKRSDDVIYIEITANNTRTIEQKKRFYQRTVEILGANPGVRPEDVFINIVEVAKENWSMGNGEAQYA